MKQDTTNAALTNVMVHRIVWLNKWLQMQNYEIENRRSTFLCICYNSLLPITSKNEAQEYIRKINKKFPYPITEEKLTQLFNYIGQKSEIYKYTNQKIKQLLNISDEDYNLLDPDKNQKEARERKKRVDEKEELKREVLRKFQEGVGKKELRELYPTISARTIDRWLSDAVKEKRQLRNAVIREMKKQGYSNNEIAARCECSVDTVVKEVKKTQISEKKTNINISSITTDKRSINKDEQNVTCHALYCLYKEMVNQGAVVDSHRIALEILTKQNDNALIYGSAGCGKSTLLKNFLNSLSSTQRKNTLIVAPTWKAALQVNGTTIHKAFGLDTSTQVNTDIKLVDIPKRLLTIDTLIIEEISLCRIDLFSKMMKIIKAIEENTSKRIRIIIFGDFGQQSPIVTPAERNILKAEYPYAKGYYAFHAKEWEELSLVRVMLTKIHRQADMTLQEQLTKLKYGIKDSLDYFNTYCCGTENPNAIYLCPTNDLVTYYNNKVLDSMFLPDLTEYQIVADGELTKDLPCQTSIQLAEGIRVMTTFNSKSFKNGDIGTVLSHSQDEVILKMDNGKEVAVPRVDFTLSNDTTVSMFPLCLAYAISVSKSQGMTFDAVNIVRGNGFWMAGMLYVALSRCTTLSGICLLDELQETDLCVDFEALRQTL